MVALTIASKWRMGYDSAFKGLTFKDEAQTALVKDPVRTAQ